MDECERGEKKLVGRVIQKSKGEERKEVIHNIVGRTAEGAEKGSEKGLGERSGERSVESLRKESVVWSGKRLIMRVTKGGWRKVSMEGVAMAK